MPASPQVFSAAAATMSVAKGFQRVQKTAIHANKQANPWEYDQRKHHTNDASSRTFDGTDS
ncbi:hypothetical protein E4U46_005513 [Claviceps purpurea]|nr:hypothetical protein E4U46_005513 [Claviceps purpurea]